MNKPRHLLIVGWLIGVTLAAMSSLPAQNVIESGGEGAVAPPLQVTRDQVEEVVNRVLKPGEIHGAEARRIAAKLDAHVAELLEGWPWKPFHHTLGISGYEACFDHPDEMFHALALALPYLSGGTAERTKTFLQEQIGKAPPYVIEGGSDPQARARESYDVPPALRIDRRAKAVSAFGVYAFWACCHAAGDAADAQSHWPAVCERMKPLLESEYHFDIRKTDYSKDEAEKLNGDLAGLIGFVRLARLNGDEEAGRAGRKRLEQLLELRLNLERVNPQILERTTATKSLHISKLARYCDLVPEIGEALRRWSAGCGAARLKAFREQRNGWFLAFGDRMIGGENYTNPLHFPRSLFAGAAFVETLPAENLLGFVDLPWCRGDFYFIEKCATALWAASGGNWARLDAPRD